MVIKGWSKKIETFKYMLLGRKKFQPIYDVDKTWAIRWGRKTYYICRSEKRPERLIAFMYLVPDFYFFKLHNFYCIWSVDRTSCEYVTEIPTHLAQQARELRNEAIKGLIK